jgi:hypothetical protein
MNLFCFLLLSSEPEAGLDVLVWITECRTQARDAMKKNRLPKNRSKDTMKKNIAEKPFPSLVNFDLNW